jgi:L-2-hydroxycarboxylate dehydrogenase (NAD+)
MEVDRIRAEAVAAAAFEAHGISEADASLTAEVLVSADARGKHSHGLLRLPRFVRGIEHGNVDPDGRIAISETTGAPVLVDGGSRLGPVVAMEALGAAIAGADDYGVGVVGVHNTNHLGMLGYYTDHVRREGYVGVALTNTEPAMPPYGGSEPVLGTNPIAIGLPTDPPFNLDMSTSAISRGAVLHRKENDGSLPEGVALDADGHPTTDPAEALEGVILPFGGAKGSGLAIAVEVLAGGFVGAAMGQNVTGTYNTEDPCTKGDFFVVVDPDRMASGFVEKANAFLSDLKRTDTAAGFEEIRLPGELSVQADQSTETVQIDDQLWETVMTLSEE